MTPQERRRHIIDRLKAGEKQVAVAADLGISRQAVSAVWKQFEARGEEFLTSGGRGRRKERDRLTEAEKARVGDWLRDHGPADLGLDEEEWSLFGVKRAVLELTGKRVNLAGAHEVLNQWARAGEGEAAAPVGETERFAPEEDDPDMPSLEEMERINEETWKSIPWEIPPGHSGPGLRRGKHAKGKRSPIQKKKRRKKK